MPTTIRSSRVMDLLLRTLNFHQLVAKCLTGCKRLPTGVESQPHFAVLKGSPDSTEKLTVLETACIYFTGHNPMYG